MPTNPLGSATSTANDFYSLLASAVTAATSSATATSSGKGRNLSNSGILIPPSIEGGDRLSFIAAQRDRLSILLSALDKEANTLQNQNDRFSGKSSPRRAAGLFDGAGSNDEEAVDRPKSAMSGMSTRPSETDFEKIDAESGTEEVETGRRQVKRSVSNGSWLPWSWGAQAGAAQVDTVMSDATEHDKGKSSGVDT